MKLGTHTLVNQIQAALKERDDTISLMERLNAYQKKQLTQRLEESEAYTNLLVQVKALSERVEFLEQDRENLQRCNDNQREALNNYNTQVFEMEEQLKQKDLRINELVDRINGLSSKIERTKLALLI